MKNFWRRPANPGAQGGDASKGRRGQRQMRGSDLILGLTLLALLIAFGGQHLSDAHAPQTEAAFDIKQTVTGGSYEPV